MNSLNPSVTTPTTAATLPAEPINLSALLKSLFLFQSAASIESLLQKAAQDNLSHRQALQLVLEHELAARHQNTVKRLVHEAHFPYLRTLDTFDWSHPAVIPQSLILQAFELSFITQKQHFLFLGPSSVGKTHLAIALGVAACHREFKTLFTTASDMINALVASQADHSQEKVLRKYLTPRLLIIDELGYLPLDKKGRDFFFQVISKRAYSGSCVITTNKAFKDWGEVFQDTAVASAIAERLIGNGELIKIEGGSYIIESKRQKALGLSDIK